MKRVPEQELKIRLQNVWLQTRGIIEERIDALDHAIAGARKGLLTPEGHSEAAEIAHKLAGSLGMFGFAEASSHARCVETELSLDAPDFERLSGVLQRLRTLLGTRTATPEV